MREGGVVCTLSALKANDPQQDLAAHRSELGEVFRTESPRNTSVQEGLKSLRPYNLRTLKCIGGVLPSYSLRSEAFEPCPHEADPSFDFATRQYLRG